jgi:hypothetical protein
LKRLRKRKNLVERKVLRKSRGVDKGIKEIRSGKTELETPEGKFDYYYCIDEK